MIIKKELMKRQAIVDECLAYSTVPETEDVSGAQARLREEGADIITFTSSSTVRHFMELKLPLPKGCRIASIGPVTTATLAEYGIKPDVEAAVHTIPSLVEAVSSLR